MLSGLGGQVASFALLYYVWELAHNAALLALIGVAQLVPLVVFSLVGGHLADRVDRRRLVLVTRCLQVVAAAAMAAVVISNVGNIPLLFSLIVVQSGLNSLGFPATRAFLPGLLGKELVAAGNAINSVGNQTLMIGSPLLAGVAIAAWGVDGCFVLDAVTFFAAIYGTFGLPAMPPESNPDAAAAERSVLGGLRFVAGTPILLAAFLADLNATVLSMPVAMFPVINSEKYGGSPATLGLFLPAIAIGGVIIGALSGRITSSHRPGILMLIGAGAWAASLAGFGWTNSLWVALPCLAIAGAGDTVSVIARGTIVQHVTPNAFRGRVNGLDFVVGAGGPQLGNVRAGLVASATSGGESLLLGGLAATLGTLLIAAFTPQLRRYRLEVDAPPADGAEGAEAVA